MSCYESSDTINASNYTNKVENVTSLNYKDLIWKLDYPVHCSASGKDSTAKGSKSENDIKALQTAYGDDYEEGEYGLGSLYAICASTAMTQLGMHTMSDAQAKELQGALIICPDHPRAAEITQKTASDIARNAEVASKREQGLIKDDGTYRIPDEMSAGTWKTMSDKIENCYWEMQDANGQTIDNNFVSAGIAQTITIPNNVSGFSSDGCGAWEKQ